MLGTILKVEREGIRSMVDRSPSKGFLVEVGKVPNLSIANMLKKSLKTQ